MTMTMITDVSGLHSGCMTNASRKRNCIIDLPHLGQHLLSKWWLASSRYMQCDSSSHRA